ncbi:MAG: hypothetical protein EOM06_09685 [Sphingobacteriia bacterium]|nr:hypothetical protein [Sphingobacteriia bacterium]
MGTKFLKKLCFGILILLMTCGCGVNKVFYSDFKMQPESTIAIMSTNLYFTPAIGLLHASVMNSKIESLSVELNELFKSYPDILRDTLSSIITRRLNSKIIYDKSLKELPGFEKLKKNSNFTNQIPSGNEFFPVVFNSTDDLIPFTDTKYFFNEFEIVEPPVFKEEIAEFCKSINVDYALVSFSSVRAIQGDAITSGTINLITIIELYDKDGNCVVKGNQSSKWGTPLRSNDIGAFITELNKYPGQITAIIEKIKEKHPNI